VLDHLLEAQLVLAYGRILDCDDRFSEDRVDAVDLAAGVIDIGVGGERGDRRIDGAAYARPSSTASCPSAVAPKAANA
jgi:hypothetical protein